MPDELIVTEAVVTPPEKKVDEPPQVSPEIQAEINRLKAKKDEFEKTAKEAEEKAIYWRKQKAESRADFFKRGEDKPPEKEPDLGVGPAPKKEDFDDYDAYVEAVVDHRTNVKMAKWQKDETEKEQQTEYKRKIEGLQTKLEGGYVKYSDFEEVAKDPTVPITPLIRDIMADVCEHPEDVAYYLGKNRTEAIKIARMTPFAAAIEIKRIEAEVAKSPPSSGPKIISDAPPPLKPLGSSDTVTKDINKMTQKEYEVWAKEKGMRQF